MGKIRKIWSEGSYNMVKSLDYIFFYPIFVRLLRSRVLFQNNPINILSSYHMSVANSIYP